jgi:hypothetical protein
MNRSLSLLIFLAIALAACSPPTAPAPPDTPTAAVQAAPTATPVPASPTPEPPTQTPEPTETKLPTATATVIPDDVGPANFPDEVNPLTGLPVSDPTLLDRRPISIKIQSYPRGQRPDWGISLADIVFDYYQNNGLTRFNAIFYGNNAEKVGPIRSGRLLDATLTRTYQTIFAFGGADRRIMNRLMNSEFSDRLILEGSSTPLFREEPNTFNYLLANTEELSEYISAQGVVDNDRPSLNGMTFQFQPPDNGQQGNQLFIRYSISAYSRWDYDPAAGRYLLFKDTQEASTSQAEAYAAFTDRLNNEQVAADNVVVLLVPHEYFFRSGNSEIIEIKLAGSGTAYAFRDGQAHPVRWNLQQGSVLNLTNPDGSAYPYKQGVTWYQVIGQSSTVDDTKKDSGIWRFTFNIP